MEITAHDLDTGTLEGSGVDVVGTFQVHGTLRDDQVEFLKAYSQLQHGHQVTWKYTSQLDGSRTVLLGKWGPGTSNLSGNGTFRMTRRPVNHFTYRPTDEEYDKEPTTAGKRWLLVRRWATHRYQQTIRFSWDAMAQTRAKFHRFEELMAKKEEYGFLYGHDDVQAWTRLARSVPPDELRAWHSVYSFKKRRSFSLEQVTLCDSCGRSLVSARFCCAVCSKDQYSSTIDLCGACKFHTIWTTARGEREVEHSSSHTLIQLRHVAMYREVQTLIRRGLESLEYASTWATTCKYCKESVTDSSFWFCMTCFPSSVAAVCLRCNDKDESVMPWQYQRVLPPEDEHHFLHPMILAADNNSVGGVPRTSKTVQRCLNELEDKVAKTMLRVDELQRSVEQKIERSMTRVDELQQTVLQRLEGLEQLLKPLAMAQRVSSVQSMED